MKLLSIRNTKLETSLSTGENQAVLLNLKRLILNKSLSLHQVTIIIWIVDMVTSMEAIVGVILSRHGGLFTNSNQALT
jgi:hypothetical protein